MACATPTGSACREHGISASEKPAQVQTDFGVLIKLVAWSLVPSRADVRSLTHMATRVLPWTHKATAADEVEVRRRTEAEEKHIGKATGRPAKHQAAEREEPDLGSPSRPVRRH